MKIAGVLQNNRECKSIYEIVDEDEDPGDDLLTISEESYKTAKETEARYWRDIGSDFLENINRDDVTKSHNAAHE